MLLYKIVIMRDSNKNDTFKRRMMKRFLLDATICALKGSTGIIDFPKPTIPKVTVDSKRLEFGIVEMPNSNLMGLKATTTTTNTAIATTTTTTNTLASGIFANLKKPRAILLKPKTKRQSIPIFTERHLFSSIEEITSKYDLDSQLENSISPSLGKSTSSNHHAKGRTSKLKVDGAPPTSISIVPNSKFKGEKECIQFAMVQSETQEEAKSIKSSSSSSSTSSIEFEIDSLGGG